MPLPWKTENGSIVCKHQRLPCVRGAVIFADKNAKMTEGLQTKQIYEECLWPWSCKTIPQAKIKDFCQPPLHKGALRSGRFSAARIFLLQISKK